MVEQGARHREVVEVPDITRAWARLSQHGTPVRRHGGGRTMVTTYAEDRFLVIQARRTRFATSTKLRSDLQNALGVRVSTQTIRTRLHESGLRLRRPCIRIHPAV
jgi:transposase